MIFAATASPMRGSAIGLGAFLNQQVAALMAARGVQYINIEQDLGIDGLRRKRLAQEQAVLCALRLLAKVQRRLSIAAGARA